nr:immunoglobulin heavy chain junction region [Mus musculus]
CARNDYGFDYW